MPNVIRPEACHSIQLGDRSVEYRVIQSTAARHLRVRVGPAGVEVVRPPGRDGSEVLAFVHQHEVWILAQLRRVNGLKSLRLPVQHHVGEILFRGEPTRVRVEMAARAPRKVVAVEDGEIVVRQGPRSHTPTARSLENWFRKQARVEIADHLTVVSSRIGQRARCVYVMGQRTKWGNCSTRQNLSFNWRLILAPEFVLRYVVTHEVVHLAIPDHSPKFWLTVQSLCPATERAKQWLCRYQARLMIDIERVLDRA